MKRAERLSKNSPAVTTLRRMLSSGELSGGEDPKSVWQSNSLFMEHKLSNFSTFYNRLREEIPAEKGKSKFILLHYAPSNKK